MAALLQRRVILMTKNIDENRDFKGVWIPKEVWLDTRLNALEKVILTEIDSLDQGEKGCYASNEHLAEFCQCSKRIVSEVISKLIKCGYIYVQNFDGRKRELKSRLSNFERQTSKKCDANSQNLLQSNIDNNTVNNTVKKERKTKPNEQKMTYDEQIKEYTQNEELQQALKAFIQMRVFIKRPLTDYGFKLLLAKLSKLGKTDAERIAIVNRSVEHNWLGFFSAKEGARYQKPVKPENVTTDKIDYSLPQDFIDMMKG